MSYELYLKNQLFLVIYEVSLLSLGCHYVWHKFKCSDGCCWRITRKFGQCLNCDMKFYIGCGKYLFPPQRGPTMSTARSPTTDQSNWMKKVQSKQLHQVILPGSHHTGKASTSASLLISIVITWLILPQPYLTWEAMIPPSKKIFSIGLKRHTGCPKKCISV